MRNEIYRNFAVKYPKMNVSKHNQVAKQNTFSLHHRELLMLVYCMCAVLPCGSVHHTPAEFSQGP